MITKERRRISSSGRAQQLWDAIKAVRLQKQIPAITRMGRYMSRYYQLKRDDTQRLLDLAVEDNLIKLETKIGTKGTKSGVEEKAYRLPTSDMLSRERHDWYCFKCHAGGEVLLCSTCHRVYHEDCLSASEEMPSSPDEDFVCKYCLALQKLQEGEVVGSSNKRDRRDLNHLFRLIILRSKKKLPERIYAREVPQPPSKNLNDPLNMNNPNNSGNLNNSNNNPGGSSGGVSAGGSGPLVGGGALHSSAGSTPSEGKKIEEELWRASFLLKEQIDFGEIERKCLAVEYRDAQEFKADSHLLVHNVIIFHGVHSSISDSARLAFRDILRDLRELETCRDCFRHSVEQPEGGDKHWFLKPCRPPHELVYAKQKGFPFWPAKVIRGGTGDGSSLDVRFFGGYHQRATVDKASVRPISVNIHSLQVKRTSALNKACEELRRHQEVLEKLKDSIDLSGEPIGNPFFDIKMEFPSNNASGDTNNEESEEEDEDSDSEGEGAGEAGGPRSGLYPGEDDPRVKEEESLLMRKPAFVPGEGPSPHSPPPSSGHTPVLAGSSPGGSILSTAPPNGSNLTYSPAEGPFGPAALFENALPLVNGSPLSIQALPGASQSYHIVHTHAYPNQPAQMRLVPVSGSGGTISLPGGENAAFLEATGGGGGAALIAVSSASSPGNVNTVSSGGGAPTFHHHHPILAAGGLPQGGELTKKKRGRPKKSKKEEPEDFVSSSSSHQECSSRFIHAGVQTPTKLLKTGTDSSSSIPPPPQISSTPGAILQQQQQFIGAPGRSLGGGGGAPSSLVSSSNVLGTQFIHSANGGTSGGTHLLSPPAAAAASGGPSPAAAFHSFHHSHPEAMVVSSAALLAGGGGAASNASTGRKAGGERELKEFADKLRAEFEQEKKRAVNVATRSLERDLERLKADHNTELEELLEKHKVELSENKKKQWCYHCEAEAIYWCCWNTAYCSIECQQDHWHREHKRMCRRKR